MCGRISSKSQPQVIAQLYNAKLAPDLYAPSHNVAPTERVPIVREDSNHERTVEMAAFGIPVTNPGKSFNLINLQSEKAFARKDFRERRCVIPVDGFYEWKRLGAKDKQPHYFYPADGLFSLAGVWSKTSEGTAFSIFTTLPNELVRSFHDRMPVILGHNAVSQWLAPESDPEMLTHFFEPFPAALMHEYEVGKTVNNPRNKDASCIAKV